MPIILESVIPEGTTSYLTVTFLGEDGTLQSPSVATYRVHDKASQTELVAETPLTITNPVVISLLGGIANRIVNSALGRETRVVTIHGEYGAEDDVNESFEYQVANLRFLTS